MNSRVKLIVLVICGVILLCSGCISTGKEFRPDQVIENALRNDEMVSYYAEQEILFSENDGKETRSTSKEWVHKDGRMRIETTNDKGTELIVTSDRQNIQIYDSDSNELMEGSLNELEELFFSPKEDMLLLIEGIQETHTIKYIGEEKIIGRNTHHIKATPRDKSSLNGEQEFWFDTEHWLIMRNISSYGDSKSEINYTSFEVKKRFDEELFAIQKTADMEVINLDELNKEHFITLDEMKSSVDKSFFYIPENSELHLETIEVLEIDGFKDHFTLEYTKEGLPFLSLKIEDSIEFMQYDEDPKKLRVNDQTIYYHTSLEQNIYTWNKDGVQHEIWIKDPDIDQDEVLTLIAEMKRINKE